MDHKRAEELVAVHGTPTLFLSESRLRETYRTLASALSGVELFYALKSNCHPDILRILDREGASFDVCTGGEIEILKGCGIAASRCIHTHPIKTDKEIQIALDFGISIFVVDNEFELDKLVPYKDKARILVRMAIQNPAAIVNLSHKFGAKPTKMFDLIKKAHDMGLSIAGISFHVGSQSENSLKYMEALGYCRDICKAAALEGIPIEIIDIGGGFPINYINEAIPIQQFCQPINEYIERYFSNYRVIAEPGRVLSGPSMTLAATIVGKSLREGIWWYYLNEGVYGSFSGKMYDHAEYPFSTKRHGKKHSSIIAGPTCDSIDVLYENINLPDLSIGDILIFESMGAYTNASASNFNGFAKAKIVTID